MKCDNKVIKVSSPGHGTKIILHFFPKPLTNINTGLDLMSDLVRQSIMPCSMFGFVMIIYITLV